MDDFGSGLLKTLEDSGSNYDIDRIMQALEFAAKAHEGQKRKSGEPYIFHPIEVAKILVAYDCDTDSIIAALLHDTVEDTEVTLDQVKKLFGQEVASLVDGLTKLGKIYFSSQEEQQIENLRKMLLAMAKDIRVILIKLADRLHNMRTLDGQPDKRRREIALETIEVYAPLAHRLGIQNLKSELEDISLRYLDPVGYSEIAQDLKAFHSDNHIFEEIHVQIEEKLKQAGIKARVSGRIKHAYSIYRKMFGQNKRFDEIYDLYAFRIIVDKVSDCYNALGYMHDTFRAMPGRLKDYIATPKPNMYQSLHTTVTYKGYWFEIQIRTEEMHRIAEMGIAAHWKYKSGVFASADVDSRLAWVRNLLEVQSNVKEHDDFIKTFKIDLFADQVFVSTPRGDIVTLPADSNPIDFAYAIHSGVGNKMIGAKINGRIVELTTPLRNGDVCEILTSASSNGPSRDWLKLVRTNEAKSKIRQWFKKEKREENIEHGKEDLERELHRLNVNFNVVSREELYAKALDRYHLDSIDEFYAMIGYGGLSISKILPFLKDEYMRLSKQAEPPKPVVPQRQRHSVNGVAVEGIDNCLVKFAGCCTPLPGDEIKGFVTRGFGVSVHKADCPNIKKADPDRLVNVYWEGGNNGYFAANLIVTALGNIGLVAEISAVLASMRVVTHSINIKELNDGCVQVYLTIDVHGLEHLGTVAKKIENLGDVMSVKRSGIDL